MLKPICTKLINSLTGYNIIVPAIEVHLLNRVKPLVGKQICINMNYLKFSELKESLKNAHVIECSNLLSEEQIEKIKTQIELKATEEFGTGKCLLNAFKVAEVSKAEIVEGVAHVICKKDDVESFTFIKHAWNILDGKQFDITKDYVWPNLSIELMKIDYLYASQFSSESYDIDEGVLSFSSQVDLMANSLRYLHTKDLVMDTLNNFGLDKKHYEQLLTECIKLTRKN